MRDQETASATSRPGRRRLDRDAVLRIAGDLLDEDGAGALTVREVAKRAGISVQGVYTLFGGKPGLCEALFDEGFAMLQSALDDADATTDPTEALLRQVQAYRQIALARPHRYALMFGRPIPDFQPSPAAQAAAMGTFASLMAALHRVLPATADATPERAALVVWALNHGLVTLEMDGVLPDDQGVTVIGAVKDLLSTWSDRGPSTSADEDRP